MAMGAPSELVGAEGVRPTEPVISVPRAEQLQDCSLRFGSKMIVEEAVC